MAKIINTLHHSDGDYDSLQLKQMIFFSSSASTFLTLFLLGHLINRN